MLDYDKYDYIIKECKELSISKNNDYGTDSLTKFGINGIIIRLYDKIERLINLSYRNKKINVSSEKIEDTLKDIINYSIYSIMLERNELLK